MKKQHCIYIFLLFLIDQLTKYAASMQLPGNQVTLVEDFFYLTYVENNGAAFGLFTGGQLLFVLFGIVAIIIAVFYLNKKTLKKVECLSYILLFAGILGNIFDRIVQGFVIDFFDFYPFGYDFPVFNYADIFVTIGTSLMIYSVLKEK